MNQKNKRSAKAAEAAEDNLLEKSQNASRLKEGANKFRGSIENLPVMLYVAEATAPYSPIYISSAFKIFGYPLKQWRDCAEMWINVIHPEDREWVLKETEAALKCAGETDYEYRIIGKSGKVFWVHDRSCFVRGKNGEAICWQGVMIDITERKKTENELKTSEERYRQMFEGNRAVKLLIEAETGKIIDANPAACDFYGYSKSEFKKKRISDLNTLSQSELARKLKLAESEKQKYFIFQHRLASGKICDVEVHSSPIRSNNRNLLYSVIYDITERRQAEQALQESEERFRNLYENANDLIYIHDLEGNYLSINRAAERVIGYSQKEALKLNLKQIVAPEHLARARRKLADKRAGRRQTAYEIDVITKDGRRLTLEVSSSVIHKNGEPIAVQGIARDVTERRRTEQALQESEKQYRDLFENANDLIYTHDLQGNFKSLNRTGEIITGYTRKEALQMNIAQVVAPDFLEVARQMTADKIRGEKPTTYELEIIAKQGHRVSLELSTRLIFQDAVPVGIQGIGRDITERKLSEDALIKSERSYRFLSEGIMHQVWTAEPDGKLDYVNGRAVEYFGQTFEKLVGEGWKEFVHPEDLPGCVEKWQDSLKTGAHYEVEFRLKGCDGEYRWHLARATAGRDSDGKVIKWFGTNTNVDDKKSAEAKLNFYALHDPLTGLPNRNQFMNYLRKAIERTQNFPDSYFAILFLDLDRFKVVNDSLGHAIGDKLLKTIAERLKSCVRTEDVVARLGGDEFTILINEMNRLSDLKRVAERLQRKLSEPFQLDNYEVFTSASIGIITSDKVRREPESYLRDADAAMYRAKETGKARYEIFDREMHVRNLNLLKLETDLRHAVERDEFEVLYQPIVSLDTYKPLEFEALIRWRHPEYGLIAPGKFISVAEETGLIIPIGNWIIGQAIRQIRNWQKLFPAQRDLSISVNLSAKQLLHPSLVSHIKKMLSETGLEARRLKLEVTESIVIEHREMSLGVLQQLNALGISLSTDDFGTGYSSLSYLHQFPFQRLKIDRSFIAKMELDEKSEAIVKTILMLGQNLNIETVAEGIETQNQLEILRTLGCRLGQGYLFSKPVTAAEAENILRGSLPEIPLFANAAPEQFFESGKIQ